MKDKIFNISNIILENEKLYGSFARKKIVVDYGNEKGRGKRTEYLDDPRTDRDVNTFLNHSKAKKMAIHIDSLNRTWKKRLICNLIMAIFGTGVFFLVPGLGNIVVNSFSANANVIGTLSYYLLAAIELGLFSYVNQKKFYYTKKELSNLENLKSDIDKANDILANIIAYKEKEFDNSRERSKIDYHDTIVKNHNRNVDIFYEKEKQKQESIKKANINIGAVIEVEEYRPPFRNIRFNDNYTNPNIQLSREQKYRKMFRNASNWIKESFEDEDFESRRTR